MNLRIMLWLLAFSQPLWAAAPKPVTLVVDDVPVVQVLQALVAQENRNLVVSPDVSGTLSLNLTRVPWRQALRTVVSSAGLVLREEGGIFYVHTAAWQREQRERSEQEQARRQLDAPLVTQGIPFSYADAGELQKAAEKLLSPKGSLSVDTRTNRLLIRDNQAAVDTLRRWAAEMDIPIEQVELAAHIVTINEKSLRELGVKWNLADATDATDAGKVGQLTTLGSDLSVASATSHVGFNIGRINGRLLDLELSALEQKQQVDIIASPRLLASHGQPASIKQGSEIPYQVSSGESGATSVEFKEAVLGMEVTPVVLPGGRVRLKLHISENMPGQVLQQADGETLAIDKQEIETQVEVKSGETLALGGIFSQKNKTGSDSVPGLGSIPWIGALFRHDGKDNERRELVVFITPRLVGIR
ncbi:DNA uptake porin HofQ [Enterobacter roggenkampii]|uniref:DNA uptake porin HofQ n=1 Tax=Enterobacter roggenkampii TaxID=1812935 RepID=A0ABD4R8N0_9ENTR|nr:DNA uptake porin HofQ [Enterobacter roggenkampii]CAE6292459.1 Type IV pilus biogenesis and competence protein PilQ [Enterobacter cloacae]EPY95471.1 outer membrane porin HofQ [Enterobacter roggenkampii EC_38VIM1]KTK06643.1 porin [Enterobacter roggenkampii]MBU3756610.1 DNA uptake porin HofQ [Enterobacter roggenkampii]MBU3763609.1 DNA uptake porin HofQ [Enterobacter roggenkampii]